MNRLLCITLLLLTSTGCSLGRLSPPPSPINMQTPGSSFPGNVTAAIPLGTPLETAKSLLHNSGFQAWGDSVDANSGLKIHHARYRTYRGLVETAYAVTLYGDESGVKKIETNTFYTGP